VFATRNSARVSGLWFLAGLVALSVFGFCWGIIHARDVRSADFVSGQPGPVIPADNSACSVCHQDFSEETLAAKHREAGVACTDCHGASTDHASDELNIMLPDVMFGRKEIEPFCSPCHQAQDHPRGEAYESFLDEWLGKYRPNGRVVRHNSICTDCHGNHAVLSVDQLQFSLE